MLVCQSNSRVAYKKLSNCSYFLFNSKPSKHSFRSFHVCSNVLARNNVKINAKNTQNESKKDKQQDLISKLENLGEQMDFQEVNQTRAAQQVTLDEQNLDQSESKISEQEELESQILKTSDSETSEDNDYDFENEELDDQQSTKKDSTSSIFANKIEQKQIDSKNHEQNNQQTIENQKDSTKFVSSSKTSYNHIDHKQNMQELNQSNNDSDDIIAMLQQQQEGDSFKFRDDADDEYQNDDVEDDDDDDDDDDDEDEYKEQLEEGLQQQFKESLDEVSSRLPKQKRSIEEVKQWGKADQQQIKQAWKDSVTAITKDTVAGGGFVFLGKTIPELRDFVNKEGEKKMRAKQLYQAINTDGVKDLMDISTVPLSWRQDMASRGVKTGRSKIHEKIVSEDGTTKFLLQLEDNRIVETVGIPSFNDGKEKLTVCISSQVGCPMRCSFCATGKGGFARNLMPHEIVDQVLTVKQEMGVDRINNVVFMGMGEPLLNIPSVCRAYQAINTALGIGGRSITISTVGVPNGIRRLSTYKLQCILAISLHAPNQKIREQIVPSAKSYPLEALMQDVVQYFHTTGRRVSFEYTLLQEVNDKLEHAAELAKLIKRHNVVAHVNLIPWNPIDDADFKRPDQLRVRAFQKELAKHGVQVSVRATRGNEVAAACGQLRNQYVKNPLENLQMQI